MTKPFVSVLIDTYNHEKYIEQCVVSAIEQDFPSSEYEIVVVDDGSTDKTPKIVRKFGPRVRLIMKGNGGQASAFNAGFQESRGGILAFLDGDDWFAQGKLSAVIEMLAKVPDVAAVGHGYYRFDDQTGQTEEHVLAKRNVLNLNTPADAREAHKSWSCMLMGALTVRRNAIEKVMPVPEALRFCADVPIVMAALLGGVAIIEKPFFYYRHHANNLFSLQEQRGVHLKRRAEMTLLAFDQAEAMLLKLGARQECIEAFLHLQWVETSRLALSNFGGSRGQLFKTEMRAFRTTNLNPRLAYRIFKYVVVGAAALALTPRQFYKVRQWYGQKDLGRLRERLAKSH
jgi:glycosyltransferase involved in cell wall biosynthesis